MVARQMEAAPEWVNEVRLVGRVSAAPVEVVMPSGDKMLKFRVVVPREATRHTRRSVDALECTAWLARVRRSVATWVEGDIVEVAGTVRRRFYRQGVSAASRVEIEVQRVTRIARAPAA